MNQRPKLGEMLLKADLITQEQLDAAIKEQQQTNEKLGAIITRLGFISDDILTEFLAEQQDLKIVDIENLVIPELLVKKIPKELILQHCILPIGVRGDTLLLCISDPTDYEAIQDIQLHTNKRIELVLAPRSALERTIKNFYETQKKSSVGVDTVRQRIEEIVPTIDIDSLMEFHGVNFKQVQKAVIQLLLEKNVLKVEELFNQAKEM